MAVNTKHSQYEAARDGWLRCRATTDGSDAVKEQGEALLPKLSMQSPQAYDAYKKRALFYNATSRTIEGLVGAIFRRAPQIHLPEVMTPFLNDVTMTGVPLEAFAKFTLGEVIGMGRMGVLVDMPEVEAVDSRPYLVAYPTESIVNWRTEIIKGQTLLTRVVLQETREKQDEKDEFNLISETIYRVLVLENDQYIVRIFVRKKDPATTQDAWVMENEFKPTHRGRSLTTIPFCFIGPRSLAVHVEKSPIADLVEVNLSHYRSSADIEHGRHYTALPTPWAAGFEADDKLYLGSTIAWTTSNTDAKVGMIEFTGQGLGALEKALADKEAKMAALGARLLEEPKRGVEAAEAVRLRMSGEAGVLQSIAQTVGMGLSKVLTWAAEWMGLKEEPSIVLNTIFATPTMTDQQLTALMALWQGAAISKETLYFNLERGEIARPGVQFEEEEALIEARSTNVGLDPLGDKGGQAQ